jgi:hypothetical protein
MKNFFYLLVAGSIASAAMAASLTHKATQTPAVQQGVAK